MAVQFTHKPIGSIIGNGPFVFRHYGEEAPKTVTITFTGSGQLYAWVVIDGVKYYGNSGTLEVPLGTEAVCYAKADGDIEAYIRVFGEIVATTPSGTITYAYILDRNVTINIGEFGAKGFGYVVIME